jgi:hypothetical protein
MPPRHLACLLLPFLASACTGPGAGGPFRLGNSRDLAQVQYDFVYSMQVFERHLTVTPAGDVQVAQRTGTGPQDVRYGVGRLTPAQRADLLATFADWSRLKPVYPVYLRGPVIEISYNGYKVTAAGGESTPPAFKKAQLLLDKLAEAALQTPALPPTPAQ